MRVRLNEKLAGLLVRVGCGGGGVVVLVVAWVVVVMVVVMVALTGLDKWVVDASSVKTAAVDTPQLRIF